MAKAVLFAWLVALMSSWSHACVLQTAHQHEPAAFHVHGGTDSDDHHDDDAAQAVCLSLCDDVQNAIPNFDVPHAPDVGLLPMIPGPLWTFSGIAEAFPRERPLAAAPPPERPVSIRFLRLTI